jgi:uncharacterized protein (DUF302 family)
MKNLIAGIILVFCFSASGQNLTVYRSDTSVSATTQKIISVIKSKNLIYFETVSHDVIAKERGVEIAPTNVILFEDPDLTTELIQCEQTTALDLPLKILVWEENGDVYIGYIDAALMRRRFLITGCDETLNEITGICVRIINEAIKEL